MKVRSQRIPVKVSEIVEVTPMVKRFRLEPVDGGRLPAFSGGAHVVVDLQDGAVRRQNAYSLMSSPRDTTHYAISVRRDEAGRGGSRFLHDAVRQGDEIAISRPVNLFPVHFRAKRHLLVAGGIGITPFMAMAHQLAEEGRTFELHYASRSRAHAAYAEEMADLYGARVHLYHSERGERIPTEALLRLQPIGTHLYVCGPSAMTDAVLGAAGRLGWPSQNLHSERFVAPASGEAYEVTLARSGGRVAVGRHQSMLEALEEAGVEVPFLCRGGACGQCETNVLECDGTLLHADHYLSREARASGRKVMPCVSRFQGERLMLDL